MGVTGSFFWDFFLTGKKRALTVIFRHMSITRDEVQKLAELARLELSEAELKKAETDLDAVLGYVQRLAQIDTTGIEPAMAPSMAEGWREDVAIPCDDLGHELILSNFPSRKGNLLHTPGVFSAPKK